MRASDALAALTVAGVTLRLEADRLIATPRSAISADVRRIIVAHRDALARLVSRPPCPSDVAERSAILEADGSSRDAADALALQSHGFDRGQAFAQRWGEATKAEIDRLPPPFTREGAQLEKITRAFIRSPHFEWAITAGWTLGALFGIRVPHEGWTAQGLVVRLALGSPSARLVCIVAEQATLRTKDEREILRGRFALDLDGCLPWWQCPAIIGEAA